MARHALLSSFRAWLGRNGTAVAEPSTPSTPDEASVVDMLLAPYQPVIRRIRITYGYSTEEFTLHLDAPIKAVAAWLHQLPGPAGGGFERSGGAIEQALLTCLYSLQAAEGRTFGQSESETPSTDRIQQWRLACGLSGLFIPLRDVLAITEVVCEDGRRWPSGSMPLSQWLATLPQPKYRHRWRPECRDVHWTALYAASRCIDDKLMAFLARGEADIDSALLRTIAGGQHAAADPLAEVVSRVALSLASRQPEAIGATSMDFMARLLRGLLRTSDWLPNAPGGHVWLALDGLYLLWPQAGTKLLAAMPGSARGGLSTHGDVLKALVANELVVASPTPLCRIRPPGHTTHQQAVRVVDSERLLADAGVHTAPLDVALCLEQPGLSSPDDAEDSLNEKASMELRNRTGEPEPGIANRVDAAPDKIDLLEPAQAVENQVEAPEPRLALDTSGIANSRQRQLVDAVIDRLEDNFDTMLARITPEGIFIANREFVGQDGDAAAIVRTLHTAGFLAVDKTAPGRRVRVEWIEAAEVPGVVLSAQAFVGYTAWVSRWMEDDQPHAAPSTLGRQVDASQRS